VGKVCVWAAACPSGTIVIREQTRIDGSFIVGLAVPLAGCYHEPRGVSRPRLSGARSAPSVSENLRRLDYWRAECSRYVMSERERPMSKSAKMPSITLSQLRDTKRLLAWLRAGKTVELCERNRVIAHIVPVKADDGPRAQDSSVANPSRKLKRDFGTKAKS